MKTDFNDFTGEPLEVGDRVVWSSYSFGPRKPSRITGFTPKMVRLDNHKTPVQSNALIKTYKQ